MVAQDRECVHVVLAGVFFAPGQEILDEDHLLNGASPPTVAPTHRATEGVPRQRSCPGAWAAESENLGLEQCGVRPPPVWLRRPRRP